MTEHKGQSDPNEPPEDVASLYSWANLHGAKYRDFTASRAQSREKARQRVEQAMEEDQLKARQDAEAVRIAQALARQQAVRTVVQQTAQQPNQQAEPAQHPAQQAAWRIPRFDRPAPPETPSYPPPANPAPNVPL